MRTFHTLLLLGVFLLSAHGQSPQTAPPKKPQPEKPQPVEVDEDEVLRVDTTLVGVPVIVSDREGRFVADLKREDFHIYEDGVEQQIAYFAPVESNVTVLLLFDQFVKKHRETAAAFAGQLGAGDKVLVARFGDSGYEILTNVGEGRAGVQKEARRVKWRFGRGIHDSVAAAIRRMNGVRGRKAIVLFSDGLYGPDTITVTETMPGGRLISMDVTKPGERATARGTVNEATESDAPFYVMQYDTMPDGVRGGPSPKHSESLNAGIIMFRNEYRIADEYLHALADVSGGRLYPVASGPRLRLAGDPPGLSQALTQMSAELRRQYSLGYYPKQGGQATGLRHVKVRVDRPDVVVRSRTSYTPAPSKP